jgi:hypothetical protein
LGRFTDFKGIKKDDVPAPRNSIRELAQSMNPRGFDFAIVSLFFCARSEVASLWFFSVFGLFS